MKSGWLVDLRGDSFELQELRKIKFPCDTELFVEEGKYYIRLLAEPPEADAWLVFEHAKDAMKLVNGVGRLYVDSWKPVQCGGPIYVTEDGKRNIFALMEPGELRIRGGMFVGGVAPGSKSAPPPPPSPADKALLAASHDRAVEKVLRLYGSTDLSFRDLYVIYEVIQEDLGGLDSLVATGWVTRSAARRFKHTANSVAALGDKARHGTESTSPPQDPMSLPEAREWLAKLVRNWIGEKPLPSA